MMFQPKLTTTIALALISSSVLAQSDPAALVAPDQRRSAAAAATAKPDMSLIGAALDALSKAGDKEAIDAMDKARKNGGKLELTQEEAAKLIKRAQNKGLLKHSPGDQSQIGEALKALVAAGDPDAIAANNKAAANGGRLQLTPEEARTFIDRAKAKGLIGDAPATADADEAKLLGRAQEAIQALAAAGDEEAAGEMKKVQEGGGKLTIDKAKAIELVRRAIAKGLIKEDGGDPEAEMKAKLGKAIQALAAAGDEEAAAVLKEARESGGKLQITKEKGVELVKRAIDKGLIE